MNHIPNALEGITVIDLSQFAAGPICTLSLALMGAQVIKIERPVYGEQGRPKGGGQNILWAILHANKKSVTLDLKSEKGKELLGKFIEKGDVLVENFAPNTIERLGFDYEAIRKINPRCVFCQIKGYNELSPYNTYPAMDGPVQATGALASQTGQFGGPPTISNVGLADDPSGH
ncbi:MAG: CoA transferase, partial [Spirochaetales bacterium]|nr:CoA transferase [Spirochaetales bacterium]